MVKIDFAVVLKDLKGEPVKETEGGADATLGSAALAALLAQFPDEHNLSGVVKRDRFKLAVKLSAGGCVDVTPEETVSLKGVIGKAYGPLVVGRAYELLGD